MVKKERERKRQENGRRDEKKDRKKKIKRAHTKRIGIMRIGSENGMAFRSILMVSVLVYPDGTMSSG